MTCGSEPLSIPLANPSRPHRNDIVKSASGSQTRSRLRDLQCDAETIENCIFYWVSVWLMNVRRSESVHRASVTWLSHHALQGSPAVSLSSRNKHVRHEALSCNRKDRNDGNQRGDSNTICGVARSTSSTSSSEGDCSTDEARGNDLRGTEALSCSDASKHRVPAPQACGA